MLDASHYAHILNRPLLPGTNLTPGFFLAATILVCLALAAIALSRVIDYLAGKMQGIGLLALKRSGRLQEQSLGAKAAQGHAKADITEALDGENDEDYEGSDYSYPGLLNTSTTCYLNSALQSLASCPSFVSYLTTLTSSTDLELLVTQALSHFLRSLNTPTKRASILRTTDIVSSLLNSTSSTAASRNRKRIMQGSGQQDAQEFFLILAEAVEEEKKVIFEDLEKKRSNTGGFHELLMPMELLHTLTSFASVEELKNPFRAMMAHRTACISCGYMEAIRHTPSENLTLNVPSVRSCRLESILADYTKLELIEEYSCRRCSVHATLSRLKKQVHSNKAENGSADVRSASKKKRQRETQRTMNKLEDAIEAEDFERDFSDLPIWLDRAVGPASKQVMFSSPPKLLVLHLSRSSYGGYSSKNNCQVFFPEYLNMDPYTTTNVLSSNPSKPISTISEAVEGERQLPQNVYRLCSMIVHFGSHYNGHYVSFRRRPTSSSTSFSKDWFRISDEDIEFSTKDEMLQANPYLLFYERVDSFDRSRKGITSWSGQDSVLESWQLIEQDNPRDQKT